MHRRNALKTIAAGIAGMVGLPFVGRRVTEPSTDVPPIGTLYPLPPDEVLIHRSRSPCGICVSDSLLVGEDGHRSYYWRFIATFGRRKEPFRGLG